MTVFCPIDNLQLIIFFLEAIKMWESKFSKEGLTFDDVLLIPGKVGSSAT